jgi:hypothetical protein
VALTELLAAATVGAVVVASTAVVEAVSTAVAVDMAADTGNS